MKVKPNEPCPCGSGNKYKRCCWNKGDTYLSECVREMRSKLTWEVVEELMPDNDTLSIISAPEIKQHTIYLPLSFCAKHHEADTFLLHDYLHELIHAYFAETVHPFLATCTFSQHVVENDERVHSLIEPVYRAATDWFVDAKMIELSPVKEKESMRVCYRKMINAYDKGGLGDVTIADLSRIALISAESIHYLKEDLVPAGQLKHTVDALLSQPPVPTYENLESLVNKLLSTVSAYKVVKIVEDGLDVWDISGSTHC